MSEPEEPQPAGAPERVFHGWTLSWIVAAVGAPSHVRLDR